MSEIILRVNGAAHQLTIDPRMSLLDLLRERLRLTGAKKGCDHGQCGACTVLIEGRRANACLALAVTCDGADLTTVEGLADGDDLHPLQDAFITGRSSRPWGRLPGVRAGSGDPRPGHVRGRTAPRPAAGRRPGPLHPGEGQPGVPHDNQPGRRGRRAGRGRRHGRPEVHHGDHAQQPDGAARRDRGLGTGRQPHRVGFHPGAVGRPRPGGQGPGPARGSGPDHFPARRRRVRGQGHHPPARGAGRAGGAGRQAPGQGRGDAAADVQPARCTTPPVSVSGICRSRPRSW